MTDVGDHNLIKVAWFGVIVRVILADKSWLFAGSDQGGHRASSIYSLVETARLNGVDAEAWLTDTISRIAELLPWNYRPA